MTDNSSRTGVITIDWLQPILFSALSPTPTLPPRKCHYSLFPYTRALKSSGLLIGLLNKTKAKQKQIQIPIPNYDMSFYCTLPALLTSQLARLNHLVLRVMSMVCWGPCQGNVWTMLGPCLALIEPISVKMVEYHHCTCSHHWLQKVSFYHYLNFFSSKMSVLGPPWVNLDI